MTPSQLTALVESARELMIVLDAHGTITFASASAHALLDVNGVTPVGQALWDVAHPDRVDTVREAVVRAMAGTGPVSIEFEVQAGDGGWRMLDAVLRPLREADRSSVVVHALDVTEARHLAVTTERRDGQARARSRFDVLGRLAGGVSHDFANLLTVIIGSAICALDDTPSESPVRQHLEAIQETAERAASMVRQLLAFSRRSDSPDGVTDVAQVLAGAEPLLARLVGDHITIRASETPGLWPVRVSGSQIEQVLLNLVVNARDAMPTGGVITIEARNLTARDASCIAGREVGASVAVTVSDTGAGMPDDVRAQAFQPFFTTKADRGGTGLGLATVQSIVESDGGWAHLASAPGQGTAITFGLTRSAEPCVRRSQPVARPAGGSETLLLVEDEPGVRQLVKGMLESSGYRVLDASAPSAAEHLCTAFEGRIDLLLTDVVLPESSGFELSHRLRGERPDLRVMYISGFPEPIVHEGADVSGTHFLSKPFDRAALLAGVRRALDSDHLAQVAS